MKYFFSIILFICFLSFSSVSYAKNFLVGEEVSDYFNYNKHLKIKLSPGQWHVIRKAMEGVPKQEIVGIGKVENNKVQEVIEVYEGKLAGYYVKYVDPIIIEMVFKNQYDGCYERAEYYLLELYRKGSTFNCMIVRHIDMTKLLNYPDDPEDRGLASAYNFWIKSKNLTYPKIMLLSYHTYFSRMVGGRWYQVSRLINPEIVNAPKSNFFTEETSEYHKHNISQFPDHSETMNRWISNSSKFHKEFETMTKAKNRHKLSLDKYIFELNTENKSEDQIIDQLNKLNDLFKSGVLTKEEFKKAKKKILN